MKTVFMLLGIISAALCVLSLLSGLLFRSVYYRLLDGSPEQYVAARRRMKRSFAVCGVSAFAAAVFFAVFVFV